VTVTNKKHLKTIYVRVKSASHHYRHLDMGKIHLHIGAVPTDSGGGFGTIFG
jgi:hypothetical protein